MCASLLMLLLQLSLQLSLLLLLLILSTAGTTVAVAAVAAVRSDKVLQLLLLLIPCAHLIVYFELQPLRAGIHHFLHCGPCDCCSTGHSTRTFTRYPEPSSSCNQLLVGDKVKTQFHGCTEHNQTLHVHAAANKGDSSAACRAAKGLRMVQAKHEAASASPLSAGIRLPCATVLAELM
jgi:hypothetical protein